MQLLTDLKFTCVEHMDIKGSSRFKILSGTIASKRKYSNTNGHRRMIHPPGASF